MSIVDVNSRVDLAINPTNHPCRDNTPSMHIILGCYLPTSLEATDDRLIRRAQTPKGRREDLSDLSLDAVNGAVDTLPYTLKILLENLLRFEDGANITADDIKALANWDPKAEPDREIAFTPARVILQDFTGVPAVVDLAAMRDAVVKLGGKADMINPLSPAELVIDHSVQVDNFGTAQSLAQNNAIEFERNQERYAFLRWGQSAFENFRVVPPNTGIVHQVNLEYLSRVVFEQQRRQRQVAYPDTLVGTDSHTTMINGLGILGWGVGGIEAEAAMLGQPITMLIPQVVGFELTGKLAEGATATDLVLTVTRDAAQEGRRRQVRRVLRRRARPPAARGPRHDRQHVARVRQHVRRVPDRRRDAALPRALGPPARARSSSSSNTRRLRASGAAPTVARYTDVLKLDLNVRRAEPRGPEAPAGSHRAESRRPPRSAIC